MLGRARAGLSGVLVLRGPAGIGKTALLEHTANAAPGFQVTRVAGVEAEQELGFAGLHRLLLPFLGDRGRLPDPQRDALETAFGLRSAAPPDRFLVGLAALTLLAGAAADRPLLAICDDAQWMDRESLEVLAFVARRLYADGIVLLFGVRDGDAAGASLTGLSELQVAELSGDDALALLDASLAAGIDRVIAARLLAETGGNPLAIRELARGIAAGDLVDPGFGEPLPLDRRLEARFLRQVRDLNPLVQSLLLVAAADSSGDMALVRRAVIELTSASEADVDAALEHAERGEFLAPRTGMVRTHFRHPLIRSAIYGGASAVRRRRAHAALAAVTDPARDADRHASHLASAVDGPDERVAAALEASAERARERGGHLAQAALLRRAAELTPPGPQRDGRLLAACGAALTAGAPHRAEELLGLLTPDPGIPVLDAHAMRLRGFLRVMLGREGAVALLLRAARILAESDPRAGRDTLLEAFDAVTVVARIGVGTSALRVAQAALDAPPVPGEPTVADLLLAAHAGLVAVGYEPAVPLMRRGVQAMQAVGAENGDAARWFLLGILLALELWDIDALGICAQRYSAAARRQGALRMLQAGAHAAATWELLCGRFAAAEAHFAEFKDIAAAIGADPRYSDPSDVMLHAWSGAEERTLAAVAAQAGPDADRPGGLQVQLARTSLVLLELGHRRYARAQAAGEIVYDENPPHFGSAVLPDLVEAAVRNNDTAVAERALARLAERATASGTPWALAVLARCRALLADDTTAEELYLEAISLLERTPLATELARTHLLYGEWLRRRRRRVDARDRLRTAHDMFLDMGAAAFAERARTELAATGERARRRSSETARDLTPQELRVARLAAGGTTNQEIASELFISASTVEYHLRKVFRKLGVTSRRQLLHALTT
ncbi:LuxR family transcriptional regulator [Streptosporangium fragile]|uniref:LuxR family transcriptional regulator n=2 Tax=Streptosporangium fragile TaxID=46186 RepID=A0ABN3W290_9ACTN